jgi:hypothetical protein
MNGYETLYCEALRKLDAHTAPNLPGYTRMREFFTRDYKPILVDVVPKTIKTVVHNFRVYWQDPEKYAEFGPMKDDLFLKTFFTINERNLTTHNFVGNLFLACFAAAEIDYQKRMKSGNRPLATFGYGSAIRHTNTKFLPTYEDYLTIFKPEEHRWFRNPADVFEVFRKCVCYTRFGEAWALFQQSMNRLHEYLAVTKGISKETLQNYFTVGFFQDFLLTVHSNSCEGPTPILTSHQSTREQTLMFLADEVMVVFSHYATLYSQIVPEVEARLKSLANWDAENNWGKRVMQEHTIVYQDFVNNDHARKEKGRFWTLLFHAPKLEYIKSMYHYVDEREMEKFTMHEDEAKDYYKKFCMEYDVMYQIQELMDKYSDPDWESEFITRVFSHHMARARSKFPGRPMHACMCSLMHAAMAERHLMIWDYQPPRSEYDDVAQFAMFEQSINKQNKRQFQAYPDSD